MFEQRVFFTSRSMQLRPDGLLCQERTLNAYHEFTVPYEDLLPLGTARFRRVPIRLTLLSLFLSFGCGKVLYDYVLHGDQPDQAAWLLLILTGVLGVLLAFTAKQWHWTFAITTSRGNISFVDAGRSARRLPKVAEELRAYTIAHLRKKYMRVNPLLPPEAQLGRLQWLYEQGVIDSEELEKLRQRLIGSASQLVGPIGFSLN